MLLAQEALNKVLKHAPASRVCLLLIIADGRVVMEIADNGVGFQIETPSGGFGLPGMRERVDRLGGKLCVDSRPGAGTRVRVDVPV